MNTLIIRRGEEMRRLSFVAPDTLERVLEMGGVRVDKPCGGHGNCGKCKAEITGSVSAPNERELSLGVRLVCQVLLLGDAEVWLTEETDLEQIELGGMGVIGTNDPMPGKLGAAIDIGTTTLAVRIYDLTIGTRIGELGLKNPQSTFAADVMGRISAALSGNGEALRTQIKNTLDTLIGNILSKSGRNNKTVDSLVITGNTTMLYLLTGQDVTSLSRAPFKADRRFDEMQRFFGGYAYLPPCISAFIGADITCAVLASGMCRTDETKLLCDIGTNGEIVLWKDGILYVTSTAAGPAFEGSGISCGCGSIHGAIDLVWEENGSIRFHTIGNVPPVGLCGSGLLDAIAVFLELGIIDETGAADEKLLVLSPGLRLTKADVRSVQLAKAAIAAGIETLMKISGINADQVSELYIAGGFGKHINVSSAVKIGLIPNELGAKVRFIGNGALAGAEKLLLNQSCRAEIQRIASGALVVNLGGDSDFNKRFVDHLCFDSCAKE